MVRQRSANRRATRQRPQVPRRRSQSIPTHKPQTQHLAFSCHAAKGVFHRRLDLSAQSVARLRAATASSPWPNGGNVASGGGVALSPGTTASSRPLRECRCCRRPVTRSGGILRKTLQSRPTKASHSWRRITGRPCRGSTASRRYALFYQELECECSWNKADRPKKEAGMGPFRRSCLTCSIIIAQAKEGLSRALEWLQLNNKTLKGQLEDHQVRACRRKAESHRVTAC